MSNVITAFSYERNGWVNYVQPRFSQNKEGYPLPFIPAMPFGEFAYAKKSDAIARKLPSPEIEAVKPERRPFKIIPVMDYE